jgi:predicted amidohydrolase YtcJ
MKRLFLATALLLAIACTAAQEPADLVIFGGRIVTMDVANPEVEALAARGQQLIAVGSEADVRRLIGDATEVIDLDGALAVPGLIEGHAHFLSIGRAKMQLDLRSVSDFGEIVEMVAQAVADAEPGQWIFGRGWHQEKWRQPPQPNVSGLPYHDALSAVSPDNPVLLTHASGHATMVNALALEMAGIDDATPDPAGGEIVRDTHGRAIGVLRETAAGLVSSYAGVEQDEAVVRRMAELAAAECLAHGITSFQDASVSFAQVEVLRAMAAAGELPVRLWMMLGEDNQALAAGLPGYRVYREGNRFLTVGGIKRFADGALGSHGAWLLEPYVDLPSSVGLNIDTPEVMRETARLAAEHGLQLCTHAIGDRANRMVLDVYQEVIDSRADGRELRWRVEHAQHLDPADIPRFSELGVIAAMQPTHCTSDGPWVVPRLGEARAEQGAYVWRSLLDAGAVIAAGTDAPVEAVDTMPSYHAAVTRRMADGTAFYPRQAMTRDEALRAMTLDAAYAAFEEDIKGSLGVGKLADVTVLSKDILTVPEDEILETRVLYTIVGGTVEYRAGEDSEIR